MNGFKTYLIGALVIILVVVWIIGVNQQTPQNVVEARYSGIIIQGNSLVGAVSHLNSPILDKIWTAGQKYELSYDLLVVIIRCESGLNPEACNRDYGCGSGMGLCQIIPSTLRYCEGKLGIKINPFNAEDNLECCAWLLKNEGLSHWEQSRACWGRKI